MRADFTLRILSAVLTAVFSIAGVAESQPDSPLQLAQQAMDHGDYAGAASRLVHYLESNPDQVDALRALALTRFMQGQDSAALFAANRAQRIRPDQKTAALIATSDCRLGDFDAAAKSLQKLRPWPSDESLLAQIAECVERAGAPLDAVRVYEELNRQQAAPADKYAFGLAHAYLRASRRILTKMRDLPGSSLYRAALDNAKAVPPGSDSDVAFAALKKKNPKISLDMPLGEMESMLLRTPPDPGAYYGVGVITGRRGIEAYQAATEKFPDSLEIPFYEAEMLSETGRKKEAIDAYRSILERHPNMPGVHYLIAVTYRTLGDCPAALQQLELEETIAPHDERLAHTKTSCLLRMGEFEKCYLVLKPLAGDPSAPQWMLSDFATAAENSGHSPEAVAALNRVERLDPSSAAVHYRLYLLYRSSRSFHDAERELAEVRRLKQAAH